MGGGREGGVGGGREGGVGGGREGVWVKEGRGCGWRKGGEMSRFRDRVFTDSTKCGNNGGVHNCFPRGRDKERRQGTSQWWRNDRSNFQGINQYVIEQIGYLATKWRTLAVLSPTTSTHYSYK